MPPKNRPATLYYEDSTIFLLRTVFTLFTKSCDVPSEFENLTALKKFMLSDDYKKKNSEFLEYHVPKIIHDKDRNLKDTQILGNKMHSVTFIELCVLMNYITGMDHTTLPITKEKNLTLDELLDEEGHEDVYILQVTWNRETKQSLDNLKVNALDTYLWNYREHVEICNDEVFLTDKYDGEFSGLLFFMGGVNVGQASHIKTRDEPSLPMNAYQLFKMVDGEKCCCRTMVKDARCPTLVKSIEAVYKLRLEEYNGVIQPHISPYFLSESEELSLATPWPPLPKDTMAPVKLDKDGLEDMTPFWEEMKKLKLAALNKAEDNADAIELEEAADKTAENNADADANKLELTADNKAEDNADAIELEEAADKTAENNEDADVGAVSIMVPPHAAKLVQEMNPNEFKEYTSALNIGQGAAVFPDAVVPMEADVDAQVTEAASSLTIMGNAAVTTEASTTDNATKGNENESSFPESIVLDDDGAKMATDLDERPLILEEMLARDKLPPSQDRVVDAKRTTKTLTKKDLEAIDKKLRRDILNKALEGAPANVIALYNHLIKSPSISAETFETIMSGKASTVTAVAAEDTTKEAKDSTTKNPVISPSKKSEDMVKEVTDPVHAGMDEPTLKLVEKLGNEDCSIHEYKTHVNSPNDKLSLAKARKKSRGKRLSSALKNLKSVFDDPPIEPRKRKSVTTTGFLLPSAKRRLVIESEKLKKTSSSSSTSKEDLNEASLKKVPELTKPKTSLSSSVFKDSKKTTINRFREKKSTKGKKSSSSNSKNDSKKDDETLKDNPVMTHRSVVKGSPYVKEYRNAPQEPVNSNILQNKVTRYRVIINSEWINQQVYMLMEINRLVTQIRRTRNLVAPRELWLRAIPTEPSDRNYPYQLIFIMMCSSALSDVMLTKHMTSIFDLIDVVPEEVIKMSEKELERMLHKMGKSNMNAVNILSMTKVLLDKHEGKVPADWKTITKFHGVGRKIASVVVYEAFGISRVPVDIHVLRFARYFGWCSDKADAKSCQDDIEGWMPEINWHLVNSTIGSFSQLAASHQKILCSEMKRMRIGLIYPQFDMVHFLEEYVSQLESNIFSNTKE